LKFKPASLILLLIAMMPAVFYTAYEFSSLSETEKLMKNIYDQQMQNVLFNINQTAWEITSDWAESIRNYLQGTDAEEKDSVENMIIAEPGIQGIFLTDSALVEFELITVEDTSSSIKFGRDEIFPKLVKMKTDIDRMIYRKKVGYDKPVSFVLENFDETTLIVLYSCEIDRQTPRLLGLCIDSREFIESLPLTLDAVPQEDIEIGIFDEQTGNIIERTGGITLTNAAATKKVWLFPNYLLGVKMKGVDLNQEVKKRFQSRLKWTLFLNSFLIIAIIFLYRSIRMEMKLTRIKSDFVSNVSHELRTPLALIRMYAETLSMNRVRTEEKKQEYYTVITKESERLSHLVNTILDFSKMETGKKEYNFVQLNLNDIISEVMEMYSFHLKQKKFDYHLKLSDEECLISGDHSSISEAIINLLDNAMKYSHNVKEITIESEQDEKDCRVIISDKGEGISGTELTRIFDKFYRVSSALVHDTKGSGLGLALVDYIMKAHGGRVSVKSKPGKGSSFCLIFPRCDKT